MIFGLVIPLFHQYRKKTAWRWIFASISIFLFLKATFNSNFSIKNKKPNSLVYIQNNNTKKAYWGTYNHTLDTYTKQIFKKPYQKGGIKNAETKSKYNTRFKYHKEAIYKNISSFIHKKTYDTIINNLRHVTISLIPKATINKFEINNNTPIQIKSLEANHCNLHNDTLLNKGKLLVYHMATIDKELQLSFICNKKDSINLTINGISYDLLQHHTFDLLPRDDTMMPMPFVTNDAIITTEKVTY